MSTMNHASAARSATRHRQFPRWGQYVAPQQARHGFSALLAVLLSVQPVAAADDVHIWIRAFIPEVAASASGDQTSGDQNRAEQSPTSSAAPSVSTSSGPVLRASDGGCIATDRRTWSDAATAPSRLISDFHLVIDPSGPQLRPSGKQVTSVASIRSVDCASGAEFAVLPAQLLLDEVQLPTSNDERAAAGARARVVAAVADPLRSWSSATVHYDATFTYDPQSRTLEYHALTGFFPAYEAYATLNEGPVVTVLRSGPVRRAEAAGSAKPESTSVELKGTVNLGDAGKRPKAPTNFTVQ